RASRSGAEYTPTRRPSPMTLAPVSSSTSRTTAVRSVSPHSSVPPGMAQVPVSPRRIRSQRPSGVRAAARMRTTGRRKRCGATFDIRGPAIQNDGCQGGWYRVNPRGFVCLGLGATLDLAHPVVIASAKRAIRGEGLPYLYALSNDTSPLLYFRLPVTREMKESEGDYSGRTAI